MIAHVRQLTVLSKIDRPTLKDTAHTQQLVMGETQARGVELMVVAAARPSVTMIPHPLRPQKSAQRERWTMPRDSVALGATTIKKGTRPLFLNKWTHMFQHLSRPLECNKLITTGKYQNVVSDATSQRDHLSLLPEQDLQPG